MWIYIYFFFFFFFFEGGGGGVITKSDYFFISLFYFIFLFIFFWGGGVSFLYIIGRFKVKIQNGNIFWAANFQISLGIPDPDLFF